MKARCIPKPIQKTHEGTTSDMPEVLDLLLALDLLAGEHGSKHLSSRHITTATDEHHCKASWTTQVVTHGGTNIQTLGSRKLAMTMHSRAHTQGIFNLLMWCAPFLGGGMQRSTFTQLLPTIRPHTTQKLKPKQSGPTSAERKHNRWHILLLTHPGLTWCPLVFCREPTLTFE